jgi:hypothetical protein
LGKKQPRIITDETDRRELSMTIRTISDNQSASV